MKKVSRDPNLIPVGKKFLRKVRALHSDEMPLTKKRLYLPEATIDINIDSMFGTESVYIEPVPTKRELSKESVQLIFYGRWVDFDIAYIRYIHETDNPVKEVDRSKVWPVWPPWMGSYVPFEPTADKTVYYQDLELGIPWYNRGYAPGYLPYYWAGALTRAFYQLPDLGERYLSFINIHDKIDLPSFDCEKDAYLNVGDGTEKEMFEHFPVLCSLLWGGVLNVVEDVSEISLQLNSQYRQFACRRLYDFLKPGKDSAKVWPKLLSMVDKLSTTKEGLSILLSLALDQDFYRAMHPKEDWESDWEVQSDGSYPPMKCVISNAYPTITKCFAAHYSFDNCHWTPYTNQCSGYNYDIAQPPSKRLPNKTLTIQLEQVDYGFETGHQAIVTPRVLYSEQLAKSEYIAIGVNRPTDTIPAAIGETPIYIFRDDWVITSVDGGYYYAGELLPITLIEVYMRYYHNYVSARLTLPGGQVGCVETLYPQYGKVFDIDGSVPGWFRYAVHTLLNSRGVMGYGGLSFRMRGKFFLITDVKIRRNLEE